MQAKNANCKARIDKMPNTYQEKKQDVGEEQEESGVWKNKLEKMLI